MREVGIIIILYMVLIVVRTSSLTSSRGVFGDPAKQSRFTPSHPIYKGVNPITEVNLYFIVSLA